MPKKLKKVEKSEQEMRSELETSFADLKSKENALQTQTFTDKNQIKQLKLKILGELFATMQNLGIDFNNLESISSFLQQMQRQDPDLVALFESAFSGLTPESEVEGETPPNLMDKYKNLQQTILRGMDKY